MSSARARANRKLYHAAILLRMLATESEREDLPAQVLLEAVGESVRLHLLDAYGWFLLELAQVEVMPERPPHTLDELDQRWPQVEPLRGELVEIRALECSESWLAGLQSVPPTVSTGTSAGPDILSTVEAGWSQSGLQQWYTGLSDLMERMSDSLDEW
jgi:hypothetical protein